ncbi:MAG: hypothetical protein EXQ52_01990 [Bryobacterales bacterium]|nr:hypothetical protein [Bryobacterales bacterium]
MPTRLLFALLPVLLHASLDAAVVPEMSLEELTTQSQIIVHGRVLRSWSEWDAKHQNIWTHHEIEVLDRLSGSVQKTVVASEPGGTVDGLTMRISGEVPYAPREEVLVFLYRTPIGYLRATGYGQGKYTIHGARIRSHSGGVELAIPAGRTRTGTSLRGLDGVDLGAFKLQVRSVLERQRESAAK